ncbi:hypothetical protein GH714_035162 [Hevea brasiliensis]|uniref:Uncharacterized protein n=1 Tax=Hevea brasiliensis TaxID=3981 RepID=A0A6A6LWF6_HEVBR|nr:hypothetical protein GH714_035162 [Hevea brasiliensis]
MKSYHLALENFECVLLLVPRFENFVEMASNSPFSSQVPSTSQVPVTLQIPLMVPQVSPINSGVLGLSATSTAMQVYTPSAFPMPSTNLFSHATRGTSSSKPAGANTSRFVGTSSSRLGLFHHLVLFQRVVSLAYTWDKSQAMKSQATLAVLVEVFDTSDTNSRTLSGADSSFIGDASFERHSKAYEEAQNPIPSKSNHSTQEVANICDDDDHLEDIPLPTSPEVPAISTPALVTSSPLSSSTILGQRAIPLVDIVDPLKDLNFLFLT